MEWKYAEKAIIAESTIVCCTLSMAGSNKLKHMVDSMMHLSVEKKDPDLMGCRVLQTVKNRFGGCGHVFFMHLGKRGFRTVAKVSAN